MVMILYEPRVTPGFPLIKRIIDNYVPTVIHIYASTQPTVFNTCTVTCTLTHTHANLCTIDSITSFLHTVIWLRNCLQSVSPGNSWASSALFWTLNKDPFLIGPSLPLFLFSCQSHFLFTGRHGSIEWAVKGWGERNLHRHLRGHLSD